DISRARQTRQQRRRSATDIKHAIAAAGADHVAREAPEPPTGPDQMMERFVDKRARQRGPKSTTFVHILDPTGSAILTLEHHADRATRLRNTARATAATTASASSSRRSG